MEPFSKERYDVLNFLWNAPNSTPVLYAKACQIFDQYMKVRDETDDVALIKCASLLCAELYIFGYPQYECICQYNKENLDVYIDKISRKVIYSEHSVYDLVSWYQINTQYIFLSTLATSDPLIQTKLTLMLYDICYYPELEESVCKLLEVYTTFNIKRVYTPTFKLVSTDNKSHKSHKPYISHKSHKLYEDIFECTYANMYFITSPQIFTYKSYTKGKNIAQGNYGTIYEIDKDIIGKVVSNKSSRIYEIALNQRVYDPSTHVNVVRLLDVSDDNMMIFERGICDLHEYIYSRNLEEELIRKFARDILLGLKHCHSRNVLHADIKPENIIIFKDDETNMFVAKIGDFGISQIMRRHVTTYDLYTITYRPPEVFEENNLSYKSDVWAAGCIIAEMYLKRKVFIECSDFDKETLHYNLLSKEVAHVCESIHDTNIQELLSRMFDFSPESRISVDEALEYFP